MATEEPLLGDTETGQSPAIAHQDTQTTRTYGALDDNAKEEQRKKEQRRALNERDIKRMDKELDVYKKDVDDEDLWKKEFKDFKNGLMLNRARNLVENTAREIYMDGRECENVKEATILAQPKLAEVVGAMKPKTGAQTWYELIKVTAQKVDDRVDGLEKLQEETKKRDRAAHATVLTTLMSLVVSYANGVSDQDTQAKMISNIAPILLTLAVALKTIMESKHDKAMQKLKKENLVSDYKRAMWEISRFEGDGASKKMEGSDDDDGGAEETNEDHEEAEPNSPKQ